MACRNHSPPQAEQATGICMFVRFDIQGVNSVFSCSVGPHSAKPNGVSIIGISCPTILAGEMDPAARTAKPPVHLKILETYRAI